MQRHKDRYRYRYIYTDIHICRCIEYGQVEKQIDRQRQTDTDRQTDTERQKDR